jgi:hypothetical protein
MVFLSDIVGVDYETVKEQVTCYLKRLAMLATKLLEP